MWGFEDATGIGGAPPQQLVLLCTGTAGWAGFTLALQGSPASTPEAPELNPTATKLLQTSARRKHPLNPLNPAVPLATSVGFGGLQPPTTKLLPLRAPNSCCASVYKILAPPWQCSSVCPSWRGISSLTSHPRACHRW